MDARLRIRGILKKIKDQLVDLWWQARGASLRNPPLPASVSSIVFICKGNICRSAFAERLTHQSMRNAAGEKKLRVESAGLKARQGTPPPAMAVEVAKEFGVTMAGHCSKRLTDDMANTADMIIAMEPGQVGEILKKYPHRRRYVFLLPLFESAGRLNRFGRARYHIQDPYGKGREAFKESFERVRACVQDLTDQLH